MPSRAFLKSFIPVILASAAFFLSFVANIYCKAVEFQPLQGYETSDTLNFGVWYYQGWTTSTVQPGDRIVTRETCLGYPGSVDVDAKWKTARAFSIITPILGGVTIFWNWIAPCLYAGERFWKMSGMIYLTCCLFQGLTLLLLDSNACDGSALLAGFSSSSGVNGEVAEYEEQCALGVGTWANIASVVLWFVAATLMLCVMSPPQRPERRGPPEETQTVTYTRTEQPDGTTVVTEQVVKGTYVEEEGKEAPVPGKNVNV